MGRSSQPHQSQTEQLSLEWRTDVNLIPESALSNAGMADPWFSGISAYRTMSVAAQEDVEAAAGAAAVAAMCFNGTIDPQLLNPQPPPETVPSGSLPSSRSTSVLPHEVPTSLSPAPMPLAPASPERSQPIKVRSTHYMPLNGYDY